MTAISKAPTRSSQGQEDRRPPARSRRGRHRLQADGNFTVKGTDKKLSFGELALAAYVAHNFPTSEIEPGLKEGAFYDPTNFTFPAGCHICEVEVDPETGVTDIVQWVAVDDFGAIINPMIVEGQVHGGIAQGVGQALLENGAYDKESGQLVDRLLHGLLHAARPQPAAASRWTSPRPLPVNPLGIKGCGEAGAIGAPPAVINAITDAIGVRELAMPATPQTVWRALQSGASQDKRPSKGQGTQLHVRLRILSPSDARSPTPSSCSRAQDAKLMAGGMT
jgi:aerobic carbon-monoxide dehydrogenase large subunit